MFEFELAVVIVGFLAGMTASVAGFGIGSFLIPLVSTQTGAKIAIALMSVPHLRIIGSFLAFKSQSQPQNTHSIWVAKCRRWTYRRTDSCFLRQQSTADYIFCNVNCRWNSWRFTDF